MHAFARVVAASSIMFGAASPAMAQTPRFQVAAKGGATVERSEDRLTGNVPALGVTGVLVLTPRWRGEIEFWLPAYLKDARGEPRHRDVLYENA